MPDLPPSELVRIALGRTTGEEFELFAQSFLAAVIGVRFVPMGGQRDGGADGFFDEAVYEHPQRAGAFLQASINQNPSSKIKRTVRRLREFNRSPQHLTYVTNQIVPNIDVVEDRLSTDLDVTVQIRDQKYIITQTSIHTRAANAYYEHLAHRTDYLRSIRRSALSRSAHITEPYVYTFLVGELDRRSDGSFADGVVDAMIVYALEGTDPELDIKMTEDDIRDKIMEYLPSAQPLLDERLRVRLEALSAKPDRRIRWHQKEDMWVLPYEERKILKEVIWEDTLLRIEAQEELYRAFGEMMLPESLTPDQLAQLTIEVLQVACEQDGLRFAQFVDDPAPDDSASFVSDAIKTVIDRNGIHGKHRIDTALAIDEVLRPVFYSSTPALRELLETMSRAYGIVFVLQGEPRVLQYFDNVLTETSLYIGADIVITALSERYVQPEDRRTQNLLKAATAARTELVLIAPVLDEVLGHLRNSDREYRTYFDQEFHLDYEAVRNIPFILIRAYLYTRLFPADEWPRSWEHFMSQFCDYPDLHRDDAHTQLRRYLAIEFGLVFKDWAQVREASNFRRHDILTDAISHLKKSRILASNDAYVYELVTVQRSVKGEVQYAPEYGYQTWWLSAGEGAAAKAMAKVDRSNPRILMRPSFLAKFIQLAPSASEARQLMKKLLSSLQGIRLARRVGGNDIHKLVSAVNESEALEDGRRGAIIGDHVDKLKSMRLRQFDDEYTLERGELISIDDLYDP